MSKRDQRCSWGLMKRSLHSRVCRISPLIFRGRRWPTTLQNPTCWQMLPSTDGTSEAVRARVYFSSHPFSLKYLTKTSGSHLYMKILEMDSMVDKEIENVTFQRNSMLYPLRRVKMEQHRISANMRDLSVTNILIGESELPRKIFVTFVRHDACNRDVRKDPFNYQHFGMDTILLRLGGNERPYPSFKCNFRNGNILKPYWALLDATEFYRTDKELGITPETYPHRNVFF